MSKPRYGLASAAAKLKGGDNLPTPSIVDTVQQPLCEFARKNRQ